MQLRPSLEHLLEGSLIKGFMHLNNLAYELSEVRSYQNFNMSLIIEILIRNSCDEITGI